jgi:hypothetical protein
MATAKKTPAKKAPAKKVVAKKAAPKKQDARLLVSERTIAKVPADQKFVMPREVADWIERANSTINHLKGKIERLERENKELKAYRKFAEGRILNVSAE